jgi:hypothetical protein
MDADTSLADAGRAVTVLYQRESGKRLTYEVRADGFGTCTITLNGKVLKRGTDALVARGLRVPGAQVRDSAINYAKVAVDYLHGMAEE